MKNQQRNAKCLEAISAMQCNHDSGVDSRYYIQYINDLRWTLRLNTRNILEQFTFEIKFLS